MYIINVKVYSDKSKKCFLLIYLNIYFNKIEQTTSSTCYFLAFNKTQANTTKTFN